MDYQRELPTILMEEFAKVIQATCGLLRFGKNNRPKAVMSKTEILTREINEAWTTVLLAEKCGLITWGDLSMGRARTEQRIGCDGQGSAKALGKPL
jgi:hypothetical protein